MPRQTQTAKTKAEESAKKKRVRPHQTPALDSILIQKATIAPNQLTPAEITRLHRLAGNQAVQRMLAGQVVQRWNPFKKKKKKPMEISGPTEVKHMGQSMDDLSELKESMGYEQDFLEAGPQEEEEGVNFSDQIRAIALQAVSNLPIPDEHDIPDRSHIEERKTLGQAIGEELAPLVQGNDPLAQIITEILGEQSKNEPDPPPKPWYKRLFSRKPKTGKLPENEEIKGKQKWAGRREKLGTGHTVVSKGGVGLGQTENALKLIGQGAHTTNSFVKGVSQVMPIVNIIFGFITAAFDFRAEFSSLDKEIDLETLLAEGEAKAEEDGFDPEVIEAVKYAIKQKHSKRIKRAIAARAGLASTASSIAIVAAGGAIATLLASNPVGWGIAVALIGLGALVGIGIFIYKIGRWLFKKKKGILGKKRKQMAAVLFDRMTHGDDIAIKALSILGVKPKPEAMQTAYAEISGGFAKKRYRSGAIKLIMRKLKSS
jgi:hypothetical protein